MMSDDIYSAPESPLIEGRSDSDYGSLKRGLAGEYSLSIGEIFAEAWQKTQVDFPPGRWKRHSTLKARRSCTAVSQMSLTAGKSS